MNEQEFQIEVLRRMDEIDGRLDRLDAKIDSVKEEVSQAVVGALNEALYRTAQGQLTTLRQQLRVVDE